MSSRYPNDRDRDYDRGREGYRSDHSRPYPLPPRSPYHDDYDRRRPPSPPRYPERPPESRGRRSSSGDRMSRSYDRNHDAPRAKSKSQSARDRGNRTPNPDYNHTPVSPTSRTTESYGPPRPHANGRDSRGDDRDAMPALLRRIEGGEDAGRKGNAGTTGSGSGGNKQS